MSTQPGNYQTFKENQKSERMALNSNNMNKVNRTTKQNFRVNITCERCKSILYP